MKKLKLFLVSATKVALAFSLASCTTVDIEPNATYTFCPEFKNVDSKSYFLTCLGERYEGLPNEVSKSLEFIQKYYNYDLNDYTVAQYLGWERDQLAELYLNTFSITDADVLNETRIKKAEVLFSSCTDITAKSVAYEVGYMDEVYLRFYFDKYIGESPEEYRSSVSCN
ncbi:helix-turn-helix domain-containing protein [Grimontia sp. AD028]|uniref:helix-turn-helix domain-containing protein n=1 Tax=Grimontia sp. AD028 TaxID=1581149 RepID=UPI0018CEBC2E|nr:helix-turn-helix domain-containing protein [Grimontia sp. AD028]